MFGRILISLISMTFWFLRASAAFFWLAYFSLPRSRILHDRRIGVGGNLDEVEAGLFGCEQRVVDGNVSEIVAVGVDELDARDSDFPVGARAVLGGRRRFEWSANGRFSSSC